MEAERERERKGERVAKWESVCVREREMRERHTQKAEIVVYLWLINYYYYYVIIL